jgi:hypothetical protein
MSVINGRREMIEFQIGSLGDLRDELAGMVGIRATNHAAIIVRLPELTPRWRNYRYLKVEIDINYVVVDVVIIHFDHRNIAGFGLL